MWEELKAHAKTRWAVLRREVAVTAPPVPLISSRKENVHRHVLRLLLHLHPRVAPSKLEALQKALEPTGQVGILDSHFYRALLYECAWVV